jgi:hypothetical protein
MTSATSSPSFPPAGAARARRGPISLWPVVAVVTCCLLAYIGLSVVFAPPSIVDPNGTALPYNFKSERGSITLLSSGMFLVAACLAGLTLVTVRAERGRPRQLWSALTAAMVYFSIDEVMGFHEAIGEALDEHVPTGPFRTWNDVVVIAYGLIAVPLALLLWREVLRYQRLLTMLLIAGVLYVGTSGVDTLTADATAVSTVIEEGIKVCCSTYFALSMLTGLVAARWRYRPQDGGAARPAAEPAAVRD